MEREHELQAAAAGLTPARLKGSGGRAGWWTPRPGRVRPGSSRRAPGARCPSLGTGEPACHSRGSNWHSWTDCRNSLVEENVSIRFFSSEGVCTSVDFYP